MSFRRGRGGLLGWAGTALAVFFLLGILLGIYHRHEPGDSEDACTFCALVHVVVVTPPRVGLPNAPLRPIETVAIPETAPPSTPERYPAAPPRAPPSS
jgi:hypothetical protein